MTGVEDQLIAAETQVASTAYKWRGGIFSSQNKVSKGTQGPPRADAKGAHRILPRSAREGVR